RAADDERARILKALGRPGLQESDVAEVHRLVKVYDGGGYSVARASAYAETGGAALHRFPDSAARQVLTLIADYGIHHDPSRGAGAGARAAPVASSRCSPTSGSMTRTWAPSRGCSWRSIPGLGSSI